MNKVVSSACSPAYMHVYGAKMVVCEREVSVRGPGCSTISCKRVSQENTVSVNQSTGLFSCVGERLDVNLVPGKSYENNCVAYIPVFCCVWMLANVRYACRTQDDGMASRCLTQSATKRIASTALRPQNFYLSLEGEESPRHSVCWVVNDE